MARRGRGGGEGEEAPFRCLDAARYAAASMVTVLILIVVVKATKVVLFPDSLYVSVVHGSILVTRHSSDRPTLVFDLKLRIDNPRRRAYMSYVNVTAFLFDNDTPASSSHPEHDCMIFFKQRNKLVGPQLEVPHSLQLRAGKHAMEEESFDFLYNNESASMSGVTMRMDATLLTEDMTSGGVYNTSRQVTYYCWPLVILPHQKLPGDAEDLGLGDDVFCRDVRGSHFI